MAKKKARKKSSKKVSRKTGPLTAREQKMVKEAVALVIALNAIHDAKRNTRKR
jgi:hypothetical protein